MTLGGQAAASDGGTARAARFLYVTPTLATCKRMSSVTPGAAPEGCTGKGASSNRGLGSPCSADISAMIQAAEGEEPCGEDGPCWCCEAARRDGLAPRRQSKASLGGEIAACTRLLPSWCLPCCIAAAELAPPDCTLAARPPACCPTSVRPTVQSVA